MDKYRIMLIACGIIVVMAAVYGIGWLFDFGQDKEPVWGVTFSQLYAQNDLGLDWKETYEAILNDLRPAKIRLVAYWEEIEKEKEEYDFKDLDWQIQKATEKNIKVVLAAGHRVPRWPECHHPEWAESLPENEFKDSILNYLKETVEHYKSFPIIESWQVENEPLLSLFGDCPKSDKKFLRQEIDWVRSFDSSRPVIITGSGELSLWLGSSGMSEIFGTTLYQVVWNKYIGWFKNIYPPAFYAFRGWIVKTFTSTKQVIISELQAEPWGNENKAISTMSLEEQVRHFSVERMKNNFKFARKTGIKEIYAWGAEWWYWRKLKGDAGFWEAAREIIKKD